MNKRTIRYAICILIALTLLCVWLAPGLGLAQRPVPEESIRITYKFPAPEITKAGEYHSVTMQGLPKLQRTGLPVLPIKAAKVLVPFGREVTSVRLVRGRKVEIEGPYVVKPGQRPVPLSYTGPMTLTLPSPEVYGSPKPFPGALRSEVSTQQKRGYEILVLTLYPVEYSPQEGKLFYYEDMTVEVDVEPATDRENLMLRRDPDHWPADKAEVREMVDNPEAVESYRLPDRVKGWEVAQLDPETPYDYVIITSTALESAPGPNNFQALMAAKQARGIETTIVTTEWIYANYDGTRPDGGTDNQTRIRNFIIDAYQTWGTEYVLLGGDGDGGDVGGESGDEIVPHRGLCADAGGEDIDYDIPADMYYGCLDGTFDNDGDGIYGEPTDGEGGGEVDLFGEVYVGRAAVDSEEELSNFVAKTLAYENDVSQYLRNIWMAGEYLGFGGEADWGCNSKDDIKDGSSAAGYTTVGFEDSVYASFFDTATLCDRDYAGNDWPKSEIINLINSPAHIINHDGHASVTYVMKMYNSDVDNSLTNDHYFIGYSQGCYDGSLDNRDAPPPYGSGGYLAEDCISEHLTTEAHGAVAFVGNSRYGWGYNFDPQGPSLYYDRQFWDAVLGESIFNVGRANQDSKEDTYGVLGAGGFDGVMRWVYYELNVFGDPELMVKTGTDSVMYQSHAVDDDSSGGSSGNDNGRVDVDETIEMPVTLFNARQTEVTAVTAALSTANTYVTITNDLASYGDIAAMGSAASASPYVFSVDLACPDDHWITFTLDITGTIDITGTVKTWNGTFQVEVHSEPQIEVAPDSYDEALDWGRSVTRALTISNHGPAALEFEISKAAGGFTPLAIEPLVVEAPAFKPTESPDAKVGPSGRREREAYSFVIDNPRLTGLSHDVLLVSPDSSAGDISQLLATLGAYPDINVTVWNNSAGDPTAADMQPYCTTIIGNDLTWDSGGLDKSAIGDALADYIDGGGKVIESLYVQSFDEWGFGGRYMSDGYSPFTWASLDNWNPDTMSIVDSAHPVMQDVTTVGDNWGHQDPGLAADATLLAAWNTSGYNYVVVNDNVVALNQLIFEAADWSGDVGTLLHNAINWLCVSQDISWLSTDPISGTAPASSVMPITITLDASQVDQPGAYQASLRVSSNDPYTPTVNVPVTMTVAANPDMGKIIGTVTSDRPGGPLAYALVEVISDTTSVISDTTDTSGSYGPWWLTDGAYTVTVSANGYFTDTRSVSVSAGVTTTHDVTLTRNAPQIAVTPASYDETLAWGAIATQVLTITNHGPAALEFELLEIEGSVSFSELLASNGGPDSFGYIYQDSDELDGPGFDFVDIVATGTAVALDDDDYAGPFALDFDFPFYGNDQSEFYVGSNGLLAFGSGSSEWDNDCPLPSANTPHNLMALMWDDLDPYDTGDLVYYQTLPSCPYGSGYCLVVQYENYHHFPGGEAIAGAFEAILFDNGNILIQFQDAGDEEGSGSTTGLENADGSDGLTYESCDTVGSLHDNLAICFQYPGSPPCGGYTDVPWLAEDPISGAVPAHSEMPITITFDASDLDDGVYEAGIVVSSNDPDERTITVPATLCVLSGDMDGDGDVDVVDIMLVAGRWRCQSGDDCCDERYDLDGDGDIDIVDIMLVVAHWGETC